MSIVRTCKIEKYMEIIVNNNLIEDKIDFSDVPNLYNVGLDLSLDANIFYGFKEGDTKYRRINTQDFDKYDIVLRLIHWSREYRREDYTFRILKSNKNEKVNFLEEKEMLKGMF